MGSKRYADLEILSEEEFQEILNSAPSYNQETRGMFRALGKGAVISYPEYLFLVSILRLTSYHYCLVVLLLIKSRSNIIVLPRGEGAAK